MYKTILVHVDAENPGTADRIQCATQLAADCHATLIGLAAGLPVATIELLASGATALAAGFTSTDPEELDARFAASRAEFDRWTKSTGVQTEWRTAVDFPGQAMAAIAGRADLLVVGTHSAAANSYLDTGDLVMSAGRPVLVVPPGMTKLDQSTAVVAWRNTRESRRALADAVPLLTTYGEVKILHVKEAGDADLGLADAEAFLDSHAIAATTKVIQAGRHTPAEAIADFAERTQASLIVAGAYGHSRVREWAFGGVTRDLLGSQNVARLLSR